MGTYLYIHWWTPAALYSLTREISLDLCIPVTGFDVCYLIQNGPSSG